MILPSNYQLLLAFTLQPENARWLGMGVLEGSSAGKLPLSPQMPRPTSARE